MRHAWLGILAVSVCVVSCTKKEPQLDHVYQLNISADQAFERVVDALGRRGHDFERFDSESHTLKTTETNITGQRLREIAALDSDPLRFEKGKYVWNVSVTLSGDGSKVKIDLLIEGHFRPKQSGATNPGAPLWRIQLSSGALERELIAEIS